MWLLLYISAWCEKKHDMIFAVVRERHLVAVILSLYSLGESLHSLLTQDVSMPRMSGITVAWSP